MRRLTLAALLLIWAGSPAVAQDSQINRLTLAVNYDLDGEAADDNQIVESATLADSTTFTIAAQPDVCRLIDMTVTDGDSSITAGTVTVTGTDCLGSARVCAFDFSVAATRGTGVKTIPVTTGPPGSSCYLGVVSSVVSSALTGEGGAGDTLIVGYTSNSANGWPMYGKLLANGPSGEHRIDPFGFYEVNRPITTSAACSTTVTDVNGADDAFQDVSAGDLLLFTVRDAYGQQQQYEKKVTARASADSITVSSPCVTIPAAGVNFRYKKGFFSTDPTDGMWLPVAGADTVDFLVDVVANANTGGVIDTLECTFGGPGFPTLNNVQVVSDTTASGSAARYVYSVDLRLLPYQACRVGLRFGTGDDADTAAEDITIRAVIKH